MKRYTIQYQVNAYAYVTIEAESEKEAEEKSYGIPWKKWALDADYSTAEEATITEEEA